MDKATRDTGSCRRRKAVIYAVEIIALVFAHQCLLHYMRDNNIVSTIFAGGTHVPLSTRFLAVCFILVRLMTVLGLPGMILTRVGLLFLEKHSPRSAQ